MVELIPGSCVFVYANTIKQASRRASGTGCAACLLNAFYTNEELKGKNHTGANGKSAIDPDILNSIIGKHKFKDVQVYCNSVNHK